MTRMFVLRRTNMYHTYQYVFVRTSTRTVTEPVVFHDKCVLVRTRTFVLKLIVFHGYGIIVL